MRTRESRWFETLCWCLSAGTLCVIGWWVMTAGFMPYDDEGYVQWALRQVADGHPLYTEVFSQYGPFFHALHIVLGKLGYPFTSDSARVMAMFYWLSTAFGAGWVTRQLTKNAWLGMSGFALTFMAMTQMRFEPGHPGGLLALLSSLSACLGVIWIGQNKTTRYGRWQAVIAACMVWTKINVGVLQLIAVVTWWPFVGPKSVGEGTRRFLRAALVVIGSGMLVMSLLQHREVQVFLIFFICSAGALAWTWPTHPQPEQQMWPALRSAALAFVLVSVVICGLILLGGTSVADLLNGTILGPIRHPVIYHYLVPWRPFDLVIIGLSATGVILFKLGPAGWRTGVLYVAKVLALVLLAEAVRRAHYGAIERTTFMHLPLLAWALATPLDEIEPLQRQARHWLAWLLCWSWLQAFPVAGTQYVWGSFLAIPLTLVGIQDLTRGRGRSWFLLGVCGLTAYATANVAYYAHLNQRVTVPLELPGAHALRVDPKTASTYRLMVKNARCGGDLLFSFPGMLSLNQWSGLEAPTRANATHWFSLLNVAQQRAIIQKLRETEHPIVIVCRSQIRYLIDQELEPRGPLKEFIFINFEPGLRVGDYDVWKRRGSSYTPVSCARLMPSKELVLLSDAGSEAARLEIVQLTNPSKILHVVDMDESWQQSVLPDHLQPPHATSPVRRITLRLGQEAAQSVEAGNVELILRAVEGRELDRLRLDSAPRPAEAFNASLPQSVN